MWQKFDNEGIVHKEFVPPGKMNGKFYCDILRRLRENNRRKRPDGATTPGPWIMTTLWLMHRSVCSSFSLLQRRQSDGHHPPSLLTGFRQIFRIPEDEIEAQGVTL
jgi:hypothetical protein